MSLQFVTAREALVAEDPLTQEGLLTAMPTNMRFQMRGLAVGFETTGDVTGVHATGARGVRRQGEAIRTLTTTTATLG